MRRRRNISELLGEEEGSGELNLTPYLDIITTLVIFMIFTFQVVIEFRLIDVFVPAFGKKPDQAEAPPPDKPVVTVYLVIVEDGYRITASDLLAPSEIPKKGDGTYDTEKLRETLVTWKDKLDLGESIILIAQDDTEYDLVIRTMDAIRMDGKKFLFPDVALGAATLGAN
ncbi:MAG: biopolymer transporter ExbD [Deltaproteobacteria bacterium]|nr:biopolymer transporter ExbD [Deltaproteobacteria bacterium]